MVLGRCARATVGACSWRAPCCAALIVMPLACGGRSEEHHSDAGGSAGGGASGSAGISGANASGGTNATGGTNAMGGTAGTSEPDADFSVDLEDAYESLWMAFSETEGAVAVYRTRAGQKVRRFRYGAWQEELTVPDPGRLSAGALGPDGIVDFTYTADADFEVVDIFAQSLGANDRWSNAVRVGDSDIGWWQDPVVPVPAVAADASGLRMSLWSRIPTPGDETQGIVETHVDESAAWTNARSIDDPFGTGAMPPVLVLPGDGTAVAGWVGTYGEMTRVLFASYRESEWTWRVADEGLWAETGFELLTVIPAANDNGSILYRRGGAGGTEILARELGDDFAGTALLGSAPAGSVELDSATAPGGAAFVTWTPEDSTGACRSEVQGAFVSPDGISSEALPVFGGQHRIALRSDGRAAIAYPALSPESSSSRGCVARGISVRRYAPGTGWGDPLTLDPDARDVTALGFAEGRLFVAWERQNRGFVTTLDP